MALEPYGVGHPEYLTLIQTRSASSVPTAIAMVFVGQEECRYPSSGDQHSYRTRNDQNPFSS
jgi:hypothetical protein